jgi:hypothetical protein
MVSAAVACLPAAVSLLLLEALFMQISGVSLALTWPHRLCLLRVLLCGSLCYSFPLSKHTGGGDTAPAFSGLFTAHVGSGSSPSPVEFSFHHHFYKFFCSWLLGGAAAPASHCVCLQLTWEVGLPPSPVEFSSIRHSHKLSHSWLLGTRPHSVRPGLFIYSYGKDSLPPIFSAKCASPSFPHVFIVLIAYYSVSLFSPGRGWSVQGAMLLWPRIVCGSTMVPLSSPGLYLPKPSGHGWLAARGPSWFLRLTWSGDSLRWLEVWRGQSFASSWWFCRKVCLQCLSKISL